VDFHVGASSVGLHQADPKALRRGVLISHSTILRWVQRYVPEFERRWSRFSRAVDKYGKTVNSLLCADRSELSARKFFTKALKTHHPRWPTKLNLDGNAASHRAFKSRRSV
jgi:transposase-like protein